MVEDVAQYAVRGGIFDIYSFGMAEPVRLEFWGNEIVELRHFELNSQRSTRDAEYALILPVDGRVRDPGNNLERVTLPELFGPDSMLVVPYGSSILPELTRTWDEALHHLEIARRRGEEVVPREELFAAPPIMASRLARFGTLRIAEPPHRAMSAAVSTAPAAPEPDISFPLRPPEMISRDIRTLRRLTRDGLNTIILCDNAGQAERLDELLSEDGPLHASLAIGVLGGGFIVPGKMRVLTDHEIFRRDRRLRRTRKYNTGCRAGKYRRAQTRRLRRTSRARHRHLSRHRKSVRAREHDRSRCHRIRGWRSPERPAVRGRPDRTLPLGFRHKRGCTAAASAQIGWQSLEGAAREDAHGHSGNDAGTVAPVCASQSCHTSAALG